MDPAEDVSYHHATLSEPNTQRSEQEFAATYTSMTDGELENLAGEAGDLIEAARNALRSEIARRGLDITLAETRTRDVPEWRKPVTLRQFRDLPEAQLAKSILDTASIPCYLADENLVRLDWFYSNAIGGIKLWVNEEDAETAKALLDAEIPEQFAVQGIGEYQQPRCPNCNSLDIALEDLNKPATFAGFFVNLAIPWKRRPWKCNSCGREWKESGTEQSPESQ